MSRKGQVKVNLGVVVIKGEMLKTEFECEYGVYSIVTIIFIYKLTRCCYLQVTILQHLFNIIEILNKLFNDFQSLLLQDLAKTTS